MKRLIMLMCAVWGLYTAWGATYEVYINIFGNKPIHTVAEVKFRSENLMEVITPWGDRYITHPSNIILVTRRDKTVKPKPISEQ